MGQTSRLRSQADALASQEEEPTPGLDFEAPNLDSLSRAVDQRRHMAIVAAAMAPDPTEWSCDGDAADGKGADIKCACGQQIRWVFLLRRERDGAFLQIGSTCIESTVPVLVSGGAADLAADLQAAVAAHQKALAETQRRQRDASASDEVKVLGADFEALAAWRRERIGAFRARRGDRAELPAALQYRASLPKAASTPARTAAAMRTRYVAAVGGWAEAADEDGPPPPLPEDPALLDRVRRDLDQRSSRAAAQVQRTVALLAEETRRVEADPSGYTTDPDRVDFRAGVLLDIRSSTEASLHGQRRLAAALERARRVYGAGSTSAS